MPSLSPGPTQGQVPGSVEEAMSCVFYKWGMRLDVRGSQMLPVQRLSTGRMRQA